MRQERRQYEVQGEIGKDLSAREKWNFKQCMPQQVFTSHNSVPLYSTDEDRDRHDAFFL